MLCRCEAIDASGKVLGTGKLWATFSFDQGPPLDIHAKGVIVKMLGHHPSLLEPLVLTFDKPLVVDVGDTLEVSGIHL